MKSKKVSCLIVVAFGGCKRLFPTANPDFSYNNQLYAGPFFLYIVNFAVVSELPFSG
jgi:hypothetical protein